MDNRDIYPALSKYEDLLDYLISFYDTTPEYSDEEAATRNIVIVSPVTRATILRQLSELLSEFRLPVADIVKATNRYFDGEQEAREWLIQVQSAAKSTEPYYMCYFVESIQEGDWNKLMRDYRNLAFFLKSEFNRYQLLPDLEIATKYAERVPFDVLVNVVKEGFVLLENQKFSWAETNKRASKFFEKDMDLHALLVNVIGCIKNRFPKDKI